MMVDGEMFAAATARRFCCDAGRGDAANSVHGWKFLDHRQRAIATQPDRITRSDVGQRRSFAALHDAHAALAITATTNTAKWTGEPSIFMEIGGPDRLTLF